MAAITEMSLIYYRINSVTLGLENFSYTRGNQSEKGYELVDGATESLAAKYYNEVNRVFMSLFIGIMGLFGICMLFSGISRSMIVIKADNLGLVGMGLFTIWFAWRLWIFSWRPRFQIDSHQLRVSKVFFSSSYNWSKIKGLASYEIERKLKAYAGNRVHSLPTTIRVPMLAILLENGVLKTHAMPAFGTNSECLQALKSFSKLEVDYLPHENELTNWIQTHA